MKRLSLKISLFFLILVLIRLPFLSTEKELTHRRATFAAQDFNAVLIGSSRTKHGLIPAVFDSPTGAETKTYNFGIDAGVPPFTFNWCEELIETKPTLKYIFIELSGGQRLNASYKAPWRTFTFADYLEETRDLSFAESQKYHNLLALNLFKPVKAEEITVITGHNLPAEEAFQKKQLIGKKPTQPEEIERSRQRGLDVEGARAYFQSVVNQANWLKINKLIELAEARKIRLYFFIPPRIETDDELREIYPIYQKLDEKYKLRVNHYDPSLYNDETSVDNYHLNFEGAMLFTRHFAEAFNRHEF